MRIFGINLFCNFCFLIFTTPHVNTASLSIAKQMQCIYLVFNKKFFLNPKPNASFIGQLAIKEAYFKIYTSLKTLKPDYYEI
jgi:hypothetical protein